MKSIVCWLWNDSQMIAPKPVYTPSAAPVTLRPDLIPRAPLGTSRAQRLRLRAQYANSLRPPPPVAHRAARSFKAEHVNTLQRCFARHLPEPHRFICIADSAEGLSPTVEFLQTPPGAARVASLRTPEGPRFPSCYRRLWTFSEEAKILGDRVLVVDIDLIVTRDVTPLFDMTQDFVGWRPFRDWGKRLRFGGGIYLLTPGSRTDVWTDFDGPAAIQRARAAGFRGSDQAWISYKLADKEPYWNKTSGIYSIRDLGPGARLPPDARLVQFNGHVKPWTAGAHAPGSWVVDHWR